MISGKRLSSLEGLTKYKMRDWISMHADSGRTNDRQSLMSRSATQLPNRIRIPNRNNCKKKRLYSRRVLDIEHGTFRPLVFTTTDGMGRECLGYHSRLAEMIAIKKTEQHANTMSWIRSKILFCIIKMSIQLF